MSNCATGFMNICRIARTRLLRTEEKLNLNRHWQRPAKSKDTGVMNHVSISRSVGNWLRRQSLYLGVAAQFMRSSGP